MPVTTLNRLQALAAVTDEDEAAISVYLDLSPSATPTPRDLASRTRSVLDELDGRRPERREARERFDAGYARLQEFLENEDVRGDREVHGAAMFAHDELFRVVPLWRAAGDLVSSSTRFALLPLASLQSRTSDVLLVEAGRELGRLIALHDGMLVEVASADDDIESRHHQGGWAQAKLQRWVDRAAEMHLAEVAELVDRVHDGAGRPPIVIAATDENAAVVRDHLNQQTAACVLGQIGNAKDLAEHELLDELIRWAGEHDRRREQELLDRRAEQAGRAQLADGLDGVLEAVYADRVETLLVAPGADPDVFTCPDCGRMGAQAEVCPYDGSFMQHELSGVEAVVGATILHGGAVWQMLDVDRRDLDASGGLGATVRF
jgi:peptide subunit release factor 1 (eRF1)